MSNEIDEWDPTPKYRQLAAHLRKQIEAGIYGPGEQLPSEEQLIDEAGLARETVRHAIQHLRDEGVIVTLPGRGSNVPPER